MRAFIFKNRGALLVLPAIALVIIGRPSGWSAAAGIAVALAGEALRIWAVGYSGETTRAEVVTAPRLITAGPYAAVRNPLYLANVVITAGFCLAFSGGLTPLAALALCAAVLAFVIGVYTAIVPLEEAYLAATFGAAYERYRKQVPQVLPRGQVLAKAEQAGLWRGDVILKAEIITLAYLALMAAAAVLKTRP